jgi:hypothetical protein
VCLVGPGKRVRIPPRIPCQSEKEGVAVKLLWLLSRPTLDRARIRREVVKLGNVTDELAERLGDKWDGKLIGKILLLLDYSKPPVNRIRRLVIAVAQVTDMLARELHDLHAPVARNMVLVGPRVFGCDQSRSHGGKGDKGCKDCALINRAWRLVGTDKCERSAR